MGRFKECLNSVNWFMEIDGIIASASTENPSLRLRRAHKCMIVSTQFTHINKSQDLHKNVLYTY